MKTILGLDISSSHIGWCFYDGADAQSGTIKLLGDIMQRLGLAELAVAALLSKYQPSHAAIEDAVFSFASAIIPQQRVAGVVLLTLHKAGLFEPTKVPPAAAKKALTDSGKASKEQMVDAARSRLTTSLSWHITKIKGNVCCIDARDGSVLFDEHAADALAVALAAYERFEVEELADEAVAV